MDQAPPALKHYVIAIGDVDLAALARRRPAQVTILDTTKVPPTVAERTIETIRLMGHHVDSTHGSIH